MSEEYYGENSLHFSIVAEDPIMVKFFLDEGRKLILHIQDFKI